MIIQGMLRALKTIFWVVLLLLILVYVSSILTTQIVGHSGYDMYPGVAPLEEVNESPVVLDFNPAIYFGSIPRSMFTLFNMVLLAEYAEHARAIFEMQPYLLAFYTAFIFMTTFGVLNVIIGVTYLWIDGCAKGCTRWGGFSVRVKNTGAEMQRNQRPHGRPSLYSPGGECYLPDEYRWEPRSDLYSSRW